MLLHILFRLGFLQETHSDNSLTIHTWPLDRVKFLEESLGGSLSAFVPDLLSGNIFGPRPELNCAQFSSYSHSNLLLEIFLVAGFRRCSRLEFDFMELRGQTGLVHVVLVSSVVCGGLYRAVVN